MNVDKIITNLYESAEIIPFSQSSKLVFMSDVHRGDGSNADDFYPNHNIYTAALWRYYSRGFTYIELGDGDELWENKNMRSILKIHPHVFDMIRKFHEDGRLISIYGNHDMVKKTPQFPAKALKHYRSCQIGKCCEYSSNWDIRESIILENTESKNHILLIHGHQADFLNSKMWKLARFLVRYLWRPLEIIGVNDPTSPVNSPNKASAVEGSLKDWTEKNNVMLIAGHTHRYAFPEAGEPMYFNDGSCVYPSYITAIEIENNCISLVKWSLHTKEDGTLFVGRETLEGPVHTDCFYK